MMELEPEVCEEPEDLTNVHVLQNKYTFWFRYDSGKGSTNASNYNQSIRRILDFQSVERFWNIYDHLKRPSDFKEVKAVEFHLFKDGINPFWEDPNNKSGGKWMLRLRKGIAARYWEDILLAIIGEQFDVGNEVCGAVLSIRTMEDIISVWNRSADNIDAINKIRDTIRRVVRLPDLIPMEYKRHLDSLTDKSSYRNPTMVFRGTARPGGYNPGSGGGGRGQSNWKGNNNNSNSRWSGNNDEGGNAVGGRGSYSNRNNNAADQQGGGWRARRNDGDEGGDAAGGGGGRYNRYDRNNGGDQQPQGQQHRPQRGDREGGYNSNRNDDRRENSNRDSNERGNHRDRERGDHRSNRSTDQASASAATPERPSNAYTAGGGSFASRVKGNNVVEAPPPLIAPTHAPSRSANEGSSNESGANTGGAGWHRVNNPFTKN